MAENENPNDDKLLDALFDSAKRQTPRPDPGFLARLSDDMEAMLPREAPRPATPDAREGFFHRFRGLFAASGLTGAAALGVWIGFVMPEVLNSMTAGFDTTEVYDISAFLPGTDLSALE